MGMAQPAENIQDGFYFEVQTVGGRIMKIQDPFVVTGLTIEEIAHALSNICRFNGNTREFYSVAQHSIMVSTLLPPGMQYAGLMHDAGEALIGDMVSPLKRLMHDYKRIEAAVEAGLFEHFKVADAHNPQIKAADNVALLTEQRDLMPIQNYADARRAHPTLAPVAHKIIPMTPHEARWAFVDRYYSLRSAGLAPAAFGP